MFSSSRAGPFDLYSMDDEICLDSVGTYENLETDFQKIMEEVGLKGKVRLPKVNISTGPEGYDYRACYTDESREMMARWYAREIARFGYEF